MSADKLRSWWIGPCPIRGRVGEDSYLVEVKPGRTVPVHRSHIKEHMEDQFSQEKLQMFFFPRNKKILRPGLTSGRSKK